jgi:RNA polymerase sigma-70 factor (ECF subfamily)
MTEQDWVSARFAEHQRHLQAVACRMPGSPAEAEDAVQEAWARVSRADTSGVENPGGWLTTVVARVCLTMLEARRGRREDAAGALPPEPAARQERLHSVDQADPLDEALLADSVGVALMVVLDTLTPAERLAFVLHDVFAVSFGEIGAVLERSPAAARQLASRARRRVRGAAAVAVFFSGHAQAARLALVEGVPAAVWTCRGTARALIEFTIEDDRITRIAVDTDADRLDGLDIVFLPAHAKQAR